MHLKTFINFFRPAGCGADLKDCFADKRAQHLSNLIELQRSSGAAHMKLMRSFRAASTKHQGRCRVVYALACIMVKWVVWKALLGVATTTSLAYRRALGAEMSHT